jgi:subtilisin family serine protease
VSVLAAALSVGLSSGAQAAQDHEELGRYVVMLDGSAQDDVGAIAREHHLRYAAVPGFVYRHALLGYSALIPKSHVSQLRKDPRVLAVAADRPVRATQQILPTGVDRVEADASSTRAGDGSGSVNAGVAIIDTGIDHTRPDLNVAGGVNCIFPGLPIPPQDDHGHGTHVAGTVAAADNDQEVVGVAPGARLYAVKVLNALGMGFTSNVVCGLDWVAEHARSDNITVANMSLGGPGSDDGNCGRSNNDTMHIAICRVVNESGVTVAVAAGNDGADFADSTPAAYDEVLTATAVTDYNGRPGGGAASTCRAGQDDTAADFSNFARIGSADAGHTIAAPGACILSTGLGWGTRVLSGTSMASPHVAGTAALCLAGPCAGMSPRQVMAKLRADAAARPADFGFTGDPRSPSSGRYYGYLDHAGAY